MAQSLDPSAILSQLTESYLKLPLVQKIIFPLLLVASVSGIIFVSSWANRPDYRVLFSDLDPGDSSAVIEYLKEAKVEYQIRGDGSTVAISPPEMVHELRISLAGEGLPKGGIVGYELFDVSNLATTTFQEKVKWLRAIQGELQRTIGAIEGVVAARVHITQPEKTVFAKRNSMPTASVLLKLKPNAELGKREIKGITNLVAGSVEGLTAENVTVVNEFGKLLTVKEEEEAFGAEATRLQYQRQVEKNYTERIEQMLARVLGPGRVIARVTAELDFTMNEREEESFDPGGQVLRSERSVEEGVATTQRGGIPGVVTNLSNDPDVLSPPSASNGGARKEQVRNFEVSRAVTKTISPRGTLVRLSAAVLVDGSTPAASPAADGESEAASAAPTFQPLDNETMRQIEAVVKTAVGYDAARGDTVTVENVPFFAPEDLNEEFQPATWEIAATVISKTVPVLFILLFFLVIVRPLVRFLITPTEAEVDLERLLPTGIQELERELEVEKQRAAVPEYEPSVDLDQLEDVMAENSRLVQENPQQAALLIRYWLNDGRL